MAKGYKTGGRRRGTPNRITRAFRDAVQTVYHDIGGDKGFSDWAQENRTEFYKIAARLIPQEMHDASDETIIVQLVQFFRPENTPALRGQDQAACGGVVPRLIGTSKTET